MVLGERRVVVVPYAFKKVVARAFEQALKRDAFGTSPGGAVVVNLWITGGGILVHYFSDHGESVVPGAEVVCVLPS